MDYPLSGSQSSVDRPGDSDDGDVFSGKSRPISRRGVRQSYDSISQISSGTQSRSSAMRPGSAYRGGTASRLATGGFGAPPPTASVRIGTASIGGLSMMDRPITQQGLSGLRTGTGTGAGKRQLRDKRYWEEVVGARVRALRTEIARLHQQADTAARERSANKHFEARGRELAQELTDLQGRLSDYNLASQMLTGADVAAIQRQSAELTNSNDQRSAELEAVFAERQRKEGQLRQITDQINKEKGSLDTLINEMTPNEKTRYLQLREAVSSLQEEADQGKIQIDELIKVKGDLEKNISMSQMKTVMVDLLHKLMASEQKRDALTEEMNSKLQPAQERDLLLAQVREDNAAIASMESNSQSVKEEIKRAQDLLDQAEQDLEEGQSERHQKYRELKKREETMEAFMSTFEDHMKDEKNRIAQQESDIVFALEHSSSNLDQLNFDEIDTLKQKDGGYVSASGSEPDSNKSVESATKEHKRLVIQLKKAQDTQERLNAEMRALPEKITALKQSTEALSDLEKLKADGAVRRRELRDEISALKDKLAPTENAVKEASSRYRELQKRLDGNEMYSQLNAMEEKLLTIENENSALREDIASITIKTDYEPIKKQVFDVIENLNRKLSTSGNNQVYQQ